MGGGFLAGFTQGLGETAKQMNQNFMDQQLARYKNTAKIWENLSNDPTYHPNIRQQFAQKALSLTNVNLFDKNSRKTADEVSKENPQEAVQKAIEAMQMTGTEMPSYYNKSTATIDPIAFETDKLRAGIGPAIELAGGKARAEREAWAEYIHNLGGDTGGAPPGSSLAKKIAKHNATAMAMKQSPVRAQQAELNGYPASFWPIDGTYYIDGEEVDPRSVLKGDGGAVTYTTIQRDEFGNVIGQSSRRAPTPMGLPPASGGAPTPSPAGAVPPPKAAAPTTGPVLPPKPQQTAVPPQPVAPPTNANSFQWDPEADDYLSKNIPGNDPISTLARRYATLSEDAVRQVNSNRFIQPKVGQLLEKAGVWVPNKDQQKAIQSLEESKYPIQIIGSLMKQIMDNPSRVDLAYELHKQIMSLGSIFAKTNYRQTGQLSNQEQVWARMGFTGGVESSIAGALAKMGVKGWSNAAMASLNDVMLLSDGLKRSLLKGKPARYIAGYGPVEDFLAHHDPTQRPQVSYPGKPIQTPNQKVYMFYGLNPSTGHRIGSNDNNTWFDVQTGQPVH